ncbi:predicted protein [Lichtheimia corymbifera JMRC:FSU:9682]|uniref:Uncharacterized protein n=1 Tax=Lichtheimia corymbifera JMRC:FSU:9682 TaxID=1263082 RepID=A0A068RLB1_9FUNG|nr:predicted protein [Lichtheimia corymbifera JMRC:FSU:9682]
MSTANRSGDKRKISHVGDPWEEQLSIPVKTTPPPNPFARAASVLEDQNEKLQQTCHALEEKLATLKESLVDIEKHLCDESRHVDEQSIFYDQSLSTTAAMARSLIHPSADDNDALHSSLHDFLELDDRIATKMDLSLKDLRSQLSILNSPSEDDSTQEKMNDIEHQVDNFQRIELEYAKAQAACDAHQTRIASLENDFKKLNHLPQIMDILRNTTAGYHAEVKSNVHNQKHQMQKRIHPALSKLADLIIREPILLEQNEAHKKQLYDYWDGLEAIATHLLRQQAIQHLAYYACEAGKEDWYLKRCTVLALLEDLKECKDKRQEQMRKCQGNKNDQQHISDHADDEELLHQIELLLKRPYLDQPSTSRRRSFHEESILNKVSTLLQFEKKWKNQWADTVGASLDAAKILDDCKENLWDALCYDHSDSRDRPSWTPAEHTLLQSELELRNQDAVDAIDTLEQKHKADDDELEIKKRLLNMMLTDPDRFGEAMMMELETEDQSPEI